MRWGCVLNVLCRTMIWGKNGIFPVEMIDFILHLVAPPGFLREDQLRRLFKFSCNFFTLGRAGRENFLEVVFGKAINFVIRSVSRSQLA